MRGREDGKQHLEPQNTGKTNCLTSVQKDNLILQHPRGNNKGNVFDGKTQHCPLAHGSKIICYALAQIKNMLQ